MESQVLQVSEFVALLNQTLEFAYPLVQVRGEVASYDPKERFTYLNLKDQEATIRCFKWGSVSPPLEDGMDVVVTGKPTLHAKYGFTFQVVEVKPYGEGAIARALELLKAKLTKEGLFELSRKRPLPSFPVRLAVVSSAAAAGYQDFLKIVEQRWGGLEIQLANVQVQGETAASQLVNAIEYFNTQTPLAEVLVLVRGGGDRDSLRAFDDEAVVRAIAASRIPTLVGVGHEQDTTLADLAADVRAATPTDAARLVVPDKAEVATGLAHQQAHLENRMHQLIAHQQLAIQHAYSRLEKFLQDPRQRIDQLQQQLQHAAARVLAEQRQQLTATIRILKNLDPKAVLERGYAIARKAGRVVRSSREVKAGDKLVIQLAQDSIGTEVVDA